MLENGVLNLSNRSLDSYDTIGELLYDNAEEIKVLDLSGNLLKTFNPNFLFPVLNKLNLDNNKINNINKFPVLDSLEIISINNNILSDPIETVKKLKEKYKNLKEISTLENPMNPGTQSPEYEKYKQIFKEISSLKKLDNIDINSTQNNTGNNRKKISFFDIPTNYITTNNKKNINNNIQNNNTSNNSNNNSNSISDVGCENNINTQKNENVTNTENNFSSNIISRKVYKIDESEEIDAEEFVRTRKKRSIIMFNEKIFKKSDNMVRFNRKNHSEGNKHILNGEL